MKGKNDEENALHCCAGVDSGFLYRSMAAVGNCALVGQNGWIHYLTSNGVTNEQLDILRAKMIYNDAPGSMDLRSFTGRYKSSVDNDSNDGMYEGGGCMAQIFADAAMAAGTDPALINGAHDAAGDAIRTDAEVAAIWNGSPADILSSVNQSMTAFGMRIRSGILVRQYTHALETLNATATFIAGQKAIDRQYGDFFNNPQGVQPPSQRM